MKNALRPDQVQKLINEAVDAGFVISKDETVESCNFRIVSLTGTDPGYLGTSYQIIIVHRLPGKGRRQSASVTTHRHFFRLPSSKKQGAWDAYYCIGEFKKTWARHNEREAKGLNLIASATVTETVNA